MTLYQFNLLDEDHQANIVWNAGIHIDERKDKDLTILLYQIDAFYVEVYYHQEQNKIIRFRSFSSTEQLQPYLEKIFVDF
jgi:hypothetical protein